MKGGHLEGEAVDLLVTGQGVHRFAAARIASRNLHGTGCVLSSAIAANIALGYDLVRGGRRAPRPSRGGRSRTGATWRSEKGPGPLMPVP